MSDLKVSADGTHFWCRLHSSYLIARKEKHESLCVVHDSDFNPEAPNCLYYGCLCSALFCDSFCNTHRQEFGLYQPMTYTQAYEKAKGLYESTGKKHFVYRHKTIGHLHKGYGTSRVTPRNEINAIFSEVVFPNEGHVSTHTAQSTLFALMHGSKNSPDSMSENQ